MLNNLATSTKMIIEEIGIGSETKKKPDVFSRIKLANQ